MGINKPRDLHHINLPPTYEPAQGVDLRRHRYQETQVDFRVGRHPRAMQWKRYDVDVRGP
jgi:hypothetical protein